MNKKFKIFISCPYNKFMCGGRFINISFRDFLERLYQICLNATPYVFSALKREEYGAKPLQNYTCKLDFEELVDSDIIIAIPEDSMGVAVELGWASALHKNIIVILNRKQECSPLVKNIGHITPGEIVWYEEDIQSIIPIIKEKVNAFT